MTFQNLQVENLGKTTILARDEGIAMGLNFQQTGKPCARHIFGTDGNNDKMSKRVSYDSNR